ncbi:antitoxin [Nocardia pseudovaccinii]|uniref:antitoxin n=1 Tax=Nocardia pseudovaccinii TaxID=189540 RepID=UPI0007C6E391
MSLVDTLKGLVGKGRDAAAENADKIYDAVDKAGGFIDEKTGHKYSDKIGKVQEAAKKAVPTDHSASEPPASKPTAAPESPTAAAEEPPVPPAPKATEPDEPGQPQA